MPKIRYAHFLFLVLFLFQGCNPEIQVYAPEKELYVVYGVLNPDKDEQYVSVTKVFQTESDALVYAADNDLSARTFNVSIQSDTAVWEGQLFDSPQDPDALFANTTGIYRFETAGNQAMAVGKVYDLRITKPDDTDFLISAQTKIPERPHLTSPRSPIYSNQLSVYTLPTVDYDEDQLVSFDMGGGFGFEVRIFAAYKDGTEEKIAQWGPTNVFTEPTNCISNVGRREMCYEIPGMSVPGGLERIFRTANDSVSLEDSVRVASTFEGLSRNVWVEVTAVDSFLTSFLYSGNPFGYGLDLLMDRKEFNNISGENIGLFGAISTHRKYIFLGACTRYLAGLSSTKPPGCGE